MMSIDWSLITPEALQTLDLENLLEGVELRQCFNFSQHLTRLCNEPERWSPVEAACLRFAAQITSMRLRRDEPSEPYGPMFQTGGGRSAAPADFPRETLKAVYPWAACLKDAELRARFLDVVWVQAKLFRAAKEAVPAYIVSAQSLFDPQHWTAYAERLERAIRLAASLGKPGAELIDSAFQEVLSVVRRLGGSDPLYLTLRLTQLLLEFRRGDGAELAEYTSKAARMAEESGDFWRANGYFNATADCYRAAHQPDEEAKYRRAAAESLAKEAEAALSQPGRGAIAAATVLSSAVQAMRQAGGGKERAAELGRRLIELQAQAVSELHSISTTIDVSDQVRTAEGIVRGRPFREAVLRLCQIVRSPSLDSLREEVGEQARTAVLDADSPQDVLNSRGRVVAKVPGLERGAADPSLPGLRWRMFRCAARRRSLNAQAVIEPARQIILHEHAPARDQVLDVIRHSPWIPDGRHESVARAIVAGFHGDMLMVGHLVPIQFEAVVRQAVELGGAPDPMLKPDGTQAERTLSALLDSAEAKRAFGEAGVFELEDLLIDPLGSNLRNEVAHGLKSDSDFFSNQFVYTWWLFLRYVALSAHLVRERQAAATSHKPTSESVE